MPSPFGVLTDAKSRKAKRLARLKQEAYEANPELRDISPEYSEAEPSESATDQGSASPAGSRRGSRSRRGSLTGFAVSQPHSLMDEFGVSASPSLSQAANLAASHSKVEPAATDGERVEDPLSAKLNRRKTFAAASRQQQASASRLLLTNQNAGDSPRRPDDDDDARRVRRRSQQGLAMFALPAMEHAMETYSPSTIRSAPRWSERGAEEEEGGGGEEQGMFGGAAAMFGNVQVEKEGLAP